MFGAAADERVRSEPAKDKTNECSFFSIELIFVLECMNDTLLALTLKMASWDPSPRDLFWDGRGMRM